MINISTTKKRRTPSTYVPHQLRQRVPCDDDDFPSIKLDYELMNVSNSTQTIATDETIKIKEFSSNNDDQFILVNDLIINVYQKITSYLGSYNAISQDVLIDFKDILQNHFLVKEFKNQIDQDSTFNYFLALAYIYQVEKILNFGEIFGPQSSQQTLNQHQMKIKEEYLNYFLCSKLERFLISDLNTNLLIHQNLGSALRYLNSQLQENQNLRIALVTMIQSLFFYLVTSPRSEFGQFRSQYPQFVEQLGKRIYPSKDHDIRTSLDKYLLNKVSKKIFNKSSINYFDITQSNYYQKSYDGHKNDSYENANCCKFCIYVTDTQVYLLLPQCLKQNIFETCSNGVNFKNSTLDFKILSQIVMATQRYQVEPQQENNREEMVQGYKAQIGENNNFNNCDFFKPAQQSSFKFLKSQSLDNSEIYQQYPFHQEYIEEQKYLNNDNNNAQEMRGYYGQDNNKHLRNTMFNRKADEMHNSQGEFESRSKLNMSEGHLDEGRDLYNTSYSLDPSFKRITQEYDKRIQLITENISSHKKQNDLYDKSYKEEIDRDNNEEM